MTIEVYKLDATTEMEIRTLTENKEYCIYLRANGKEFVKGDLTKKELNVYIRTFISMHKAVSQDYFSYSKQIVSGNQPIHNL